MSPREEIPEVKKKTGKLKLIIVLLSVIIFLGSAAAGYFIFFAPEESAGKEKSSDIRSMKLETFTVNLADMEFRRYLRTDITLELYNKDAEEEIKRKNHRVRDKIITMLNHKSVKDFDSRQKIEKTRLELLSAVNSILSEENQIKALYFETFIIQ